MTDEKLTPERAVRLLRAKVAELEATVLAGWQSEPAIDITLLAADIALIAQLVADHIEDNQTVRITGPQASGTNYQYPANVTQEMLDSKIPQNPHKIIDND